MIARMLGIMLCFSLTQGCGDFSTIGREPEFSPLEGSYQHHAIYSTPMPPYSRPDGPTNAASLWNSTSHSMLGQRRAAQRGDILTVVIEIDDSAEISNSSGRTRSGNQSMGIPQLMGLPQRVDRILPEGASMANAVETGSTSSFSGSGDVSRSEQMTLRIAATVVEQLANGVLRIEGQQEVRVNFELRDLTVTGYVRPNDISRENEVTYDKIAGARIAYGGRGQISEVQQPRYGQQFTDRVLPF